MKELDEVLNVFMDTKRQWLSSKMPEAEKEDMVETLKICTKEKIINGIKEEYKKELKKEIYQEIQRENYNKKIDELKKLMWEGFIIAFFVGLSVNQATDIISFYKGASSLPSIGATVIITLILIAISIGVYVYTFLSNVLALIKDWKDEKQNKQEDGI